MQRATVTRVLDALAASGIVDSRQGPRNATHSVIARGLDPGAEVIVFPGDRVADGARIRVRR